jgi:(p)ppGpp synthase/HD superfamily hydrolase
MNKIQTEARAVAVNAHKGQYYDEIFPYEKHLDDVVSVLLKHGYDGDYIIAGYLHDIIEDTTVSYNKIKSYFGINVAEIVYCVTDELGRTRKERKTKTLPKIRENHDAIIVKLADRIANISHGGKIQMYAKEYKEFKNELWIPGVGDSLWIILDELLMNYNTKQ